MQYFPIGVVQRAERNAGDYERPVVFSVEKLESIRHKPAVQHRIRERKVSENHARTRLLLRLVGLRSSVLVRRSSRLVVRFGRRSRAGIVDHRLRVVPGVLGAVVVDSIVVSRRFRHSRVEKSVAVGRVVLAVEGVLPLADRAAKVRAHLGVVRTHQSETAVEAALDTAERRCERKTRR